MSQTSIPTDTDQRSSSLHYHTRKEAEERRKGDRSFPPSERQESSSRDPAQSKSERLEEAERLMEQTKATHLQLDVGDLEKVSENMIIERTEQGFNAYVVIEE